MEAFVGSAIFEKIGIVGAGQMGSGIAQVCAQLGSQTTLVDLKRTQLDKAKSTIDRSAKKLLEKSKINSEDFEKITSLIHYTESSKELKSCPLIIEAVDEKQNLKESVLREIETVASKDCIIGSNTSSISITKLSSSLKDPTRMLGIHFMNPVPLMKLVEVIPGMHTNTSTTEKTLTFIKELGKSPIKSKDYPGFVINRILMPMINEAFFTLGEGVSSAEEIDIGMKLGTNQPMGPLQLADFIGLDTCLAIMTVLYEGFKDTKYRPSPLLTQYVDAGLLGKKTGQGVYKYT